MRPSPRESASYASRRVSEWQSSKSTQPSRWKWAANWRDLAVCFDDVRNHHQQVMLKSFTETGGGL